MVVGFSIGSPQVLDTIGLDRLETERCSRGNLIGSFGT